MRLRQFPRARLHRVPRIPPVRHAGQAAQAVGAVTDRAQRAGRTCRGADGHLAQPDHRRARAHADSIYAAGAVIATCADAPDAASSAAAENLRRPGSALHTPRSADLRGATPSTNCCTVSDQANPRSSDYTACWSSETLLCSQAVPWMRRPVSKRLPLSSRHDGAIRPIRLVEVK